MRLAEVLGHAQPRALLLRAVSARSVPQSLLFDGPEGVGKRTTALALAAAINCQQPGIDGDALRLVLVVPSHCPGAAPRHRVARAQREGHHHRRDGPRHHRPGELPSVRGAASRRRSSTRPTACSRRRRTRCSRPSRSRPRRRCSCSSRHGPIHCSRPSARGARASASGGSVPPISRRSWSATAASRPPRRPDSPPSAMGASRERSRRTPVNSSRRAAAAMALLQGVAGRPPVGARLGLAQKLVEDPAQARRRHRSRGPGASPRGARRCSCATSVSWVPRLPSTAAVTRRLPIRTWGAISPAMARHFDTARVLDSFAAVEQARRSLDRNQSAKVVADWLVCEM